MDSTALLAILATLTCALGFLSRPRSLYELARPRFVVPFVIFLGVLSPALQSVWLPQSFDVYGRARTECGTFALEFLILCMLFFWTGYALPLGKFLGAPLRRLQVTVPVSSDRLRPLATISSVLCLLLVLLISGTRGLGIGDSRGLLVMLVGEIPGVSVAVPVFGGLAAALVGVSWPERGQRSPFVIFWGIFCLFCASLPFMAGFSRGSGMLVVIAVTAYMLRRQRVPVVSMLLSFVWLGLCAHAGLKGRGEYGHYAGVVPYLTYLFTQSIFDPAGVWDLLISGGNDGFTALCVIMKAVPVVDCHPLPPLKWLLLEIPVPRVFGLMPDYTLDVTYYLGGQGSWGFTPGIFGDVFAHLGWAGAATFLPLGGLYRMADQLAFPDAQRRASQQAAGTVSPYMIFLFASYSAMMIGVFNTFRSWVVAFFYPLYVVVLATLVLRVLLRRDPYATDAPTDLGHGAAAEPIGNAYHPVPE